jgi:predicted TIM-barrel fold metal-dependent hydrolase
MPYVDTHAHVFLRSLPMAADRRYTPSADCPTELYMSVLADHDVGYGVLVQPSFLGTDNSYMVRALEQHPDRLRGIAVVDPSVSDQELEQMDLAGVTGIRFNMIGRDVATLAAPDMVSLLRRVGALGWQVEVQARGAEIPRVFAALEVFDGPVVIDHFGLPDPGMGIRDQGFRAILAEGPGGRTFVKMSAGYRSRGLDVASFAGALLAVLGPKRLLWGSDWPFTQFEQDSSFQRMVNELIRWVPDKQTRDALDQTALGLFNYSNELRSFILGGSGLASAGSR